MVNRTLNIPRVNFTTNLSNQIFSNRLFNINWTGYDTDNDTLAYAILFSTDGGSNYTTLEIDYLNTSVTLNSSQLSDCGACRLKLLVTDGINTNSTVSDAFDINNDLQISDLNVVYQNTTERVFRFSINNTFINQNITNISWSLDAGQTIINSNTTLNITLAAQEEALIFVYYNYTSPGNYTVTATAYNAQFTERRSIIINT